MANQALSPTKSDEARLIWLFAGGLGLLLVLRIIALRYNATDLFFDEAQYWSWSLEPDFGYYSKPPLIAWLIRAATESCGINEFCVRLPSPIIHTATSVVVYLIGQRLYDVKTGVLSGLAFATLPGVSLSAGIISTDVPLLFAWALALYAFAALFDTKGWWPALVLGIAIGIGLNAKYAMAWFVLSAAIYLIVTPERRWLLRDARLWVGLALGVALIAPNIVWNYTNHFATFSHTADNAKWTGSLIHPNKALEFVLSQFGVFGPILFAGLLVISYRAWKYGVPEADRLLLAFTLPVLLAITGQAFLSRAHANWAAVSYVAATVLVMATMVRDLSWGWLKSSFAIHVAAALLLAVGTATAGSFALPFMTDPFARTMGWEEVADATDKVLDKAKAEGRPFGAVITDARSVTAELLYYMRDEPTPVLAWREPGPPQDHYELSRPFTGRSPEPVLLVSLTDEAKNVTEDFTTVTKLSVEKLQAGAKEQRAVTFYALAGYKKK